MLSTKLQDLQSAEGWTDWTLLQILFDWLAVQPQETQDRCLHYVKGRAAEEEEETR
jgi:hypothetical protein